MRLSQVLRWGRLAFIRGMNHCDFWLPAPAARGTGGQAAPENSCWGGGGGEEEGFLLAWFSSAQVFAILNKCAVSVLSSLSAETYNEG